MDVEQLRVYCLSKRGVTESFPFNETTLVFKVMGKMWALCALVRYPAQVNLKCDPERSIQLREEYFKTIIPGFHMNKTHWNTVSIEGIPKNLLIELIDHSYDLVVAKLSLKLKSELKAL